MSKRREKLAQASLKRFLEKTKSGWQWRIKHYKAMSSLEELESKTNKKL
ncbi:hypothetical protein [Desulfurella sp.]|nr:hypothetical protein [Desulfurella sp.]